MASRSLIARIDQAFADPAGQPPPQASGAACGAIRGPMSASRAQSTTAVTFRNLPDELVVALRIRFADALVGPRARPCPGGLMPGTAMRHG
jgi:hypothetical protein